jgi:ATP synthase protein I
MAVLQIAEEFVLKTIWRLICLQVAAIVVATLVSGVWGWPAARSALLGGLACWLPNLLFAWRMWVGRQRARHLAAVAATTSGAASAVSPPVNPAGFFFGEFVKLMATIALLFAVARYVPDVVWPALFFGVVLVLKSYLLLLHPRLRN